MLEPKSLRKALIPPSLLSNPSPGSLQSTRLALHVNDDNSCCSVFIASGCQVYKIELSLDESMVSKGKESLLVPIHAQVLKSSVVDRCPHRSEIQSIVLEEGDGEDSLFMGTVDSYGHLIVSRLDRNVADVHKVSYSVLPRDSGVGEGSWAGVCFSTVDRSTAAVARCFCKSVDVYDQDIHIRSLHTLSYPTSLCFLQSPPAVGSSVLAVAEGSQITGVCFSSLDPAYIYVQSIDYEVLCGQWKESKKQFSFRGDSNWLGFGKCANKDVLAGWCDSGSIFVADIKNI